jgi:hypothetical protein
MPSSLGDQLADAGIVSDEPATAMDPSEAGITTVPVDVLQPGDLPAAVEAEAEDTTPPAAQLPAVVQPGEVAPTAQQMQIAWMAWLQAPSLMGLPRWMVLAAAGWLGWYLGRRR